jgi:hypothetical protein
VRKNLKYYLAGSIALITFLVYLGALHNTFAWDDRAYVLGNPHIRSLDVTLLKWAFLDFYSANWHPLTWMTHALDYALWGLNPLGHHLTNNILHAANTFLTVILVVRLLEVLKTKKAPNEGPSFLTDRAILITAGTTGLLFGLHPLHVESVAWVAQRKDFLCALFFLLCIILYTKYVSEADNETTHRTSRFFNRRYLAVLGFFVLALLSKPMAVSLPLVLMILDWYPFNRIYSFKTFRSALFEKLPLAILSLASSIVTIMAQKAVGAVARPEVIPLSARMLVAAQSLTAYLFKMVFPHGLIPFYSYPLPSEISLYRFKYQLSIAVLIGITAACMTLMKKNKLWLSSWAYYIVTLLPVLGIVQVGGQSMADRYTYLPSLGPFLITGLGAAWISGKANILKKRTQVIKFSAQALLS